MAKVSGSYESVVRGVSQQVPQDRRSGQHFEQINMISDPVHGLARRHGSLMQDELPIAVYNDVTYPALLADTARHKVATFFVGGVEYDLIHRTVASTLGRTTFAWALNKDTGKFLPISYAAGDTALDTLVSGGVSAWANVGRFLLLAGNTITPTYTAADTFGPVSNKQHIVGWIRGGAYSRTFKITLTKYDGTKVVGQYKTVSASYPTLLDTSDLMASDPDYQKKVNDRVNAWNAAVTQWIGTSAADITPENIAQKLVDSLVSQGVTATRNGGNVLVNDPNFKDGAGEDGGDGSLIHVVGDELSAPDLVSAFHWAGKVVRIKPKRGNGEDAFYLEAVPKHDGDTGFCEVSWREGSGYQVTPAEVFVIGTVKDGTLYLGSSPESLSATLGFTVPEFKPNLVGDDLTCPIPNFFGKRIDYLGVFQDRLLVGSGATITASRPGDYFNWFRQSVLSVIPTDSWEGYALGSEEDTIHYSTTYDRNLLLYGERFQYTISGRERFDARTGNITIASKFSDANLAAPQASGNLVFYATYSGEPGKEKTSLHQLQAGQIVDSPESYEASEALDDYIVGKPVEIATLTSPNTVVLRTDAIRSGVYIYSYLDSAGGQERLFDSWGSWSWAPDVGEIVGLSTGKSGYLMYMLRHGKDASGADKVWIAAERFVRDTGLSPRPHLDSIRPYAPDARFHANLVSAQAAVAVGVGSQYRLLGSPWADRATFAASYPTALASSWQGFNFPASFTPTNPYMRDRNEKAILTGRLTLGKFIVTVTDTGGLVADVVTSRSTDRSLDFNGRILGDPANILGQQPIVATTLNAAVGREVRDFRCTFSAKTWLPMTVTTIEWIGQSFNNIRRIS